MRLSPLPALAIAVLVVACDGNDEPDAPAQCERLLDAICAKDVSCGGESLEACQAALLADPAFPDTGCATAIRIRDRGELDACIAEIPTSACDGATPTSCAGQVVFP